MKNLDWGSFRSQSHLPDYGLVTRIYHIQIYRKQQQKVPDIIFRYAIVVVQVYKEYVYAPRTYTIHAMDGGAFYIIIYSIFL